MPGTTLPADHASQIGSVIARIERSERITVPVADAPWFSQIFSYPGAMTNNIVSPPWYVMRSGLIELVRVSLVTGASVDHTIAVLVNGVSQGQFTLPSGQVTILLPAAISVDYSSYVTIETISVADSNMSVEVRIR